MRKLADDAFQSLFSGQLEELFSLLRQVVAVPNLGAHIEKSAKQFLSLDEWDLPKVITIAVQKIEDIVGDRGFRQQLWWRRVDVHSFL